MYKLKTYLPVKAGVSIMFVIALVGSALGQSDSSKKVDVTTKTNANLAIPLTIDARQNGAWTVGIEPTKNTVQLSNTPSNPLPVTVIGTGSVRKPFQARVAVSPQNEGFESAALAIPAGKRLVIENVSAITRCPDGLKMELNFFSYMDSNGDGVGDFNDITFHRIALTDQGTFGGVAIASANHKVLVFADEQIGTGRFVVTLQGRLNGTTAGTVQGQVTFSGYLEDLPFLQ